MLSMHPQQIHTDIQILRKMLKERYEMTTFIDNAKISSPPKKQHTKMTRNCPADKNRFTSQQL